MKSKGILLESKYPEYQHLIKGQLQKVWRDGFPVDEHKLLILQFDRFICDVDVMAENQEWTEGDRQAVEGALERFLTDVSFRDFWIHTAPKPGLPWPTYDSTHHNQIPVIAQATGTVDAAIAYETRGREDGPRPSVVEKLQELRAKEPEKAEIRDDDLAAV